MRPAIVHRYSFAPNDIIEALLGEDVLDADAIEVRVQNGLVIIDAIGPGAAARAGEPDPAGREEASRPTRRFFLHPESGSLFIVDDGSDPRDIDPLVEELTEEQYFQAKEDEEYEEMQDREAGTTPSGQGGREEEAEEEATPKGGEMARIAGILCNEKSFQIFMDEKTAEATAAALRNTIGVQSRAEIDHDRNALHEFKKLKAEYEAWKLG